MKEDDLGLVSPEPTELEAASWDGLVYGAELELRRLE